MTRLWLAALLLVGCGDDDGVDTSDAAADGDIADTSRGDTAIEDANAPEDADVEDTAIDANEPDAIVDAGDDATPDAGTDGGCRAVERAACATTGQVTIVRYTDRGEFEAALAGLCPRTVDFDDVDATEGDEVPIEPNRYEASHGVVIDGEDGQFVDDTFLQPTDFVAVSTPNMYAPGARAGVDDEDGSGGNNTDVTFSASGDDACVAGFGSYFIDVDYVSHGASSLAVYDADDEELDNYDDFEGDDASQLFVGMIAVDGDGDPVAVIKRAHLVNGGEYPAVYAGEGVTLDDFVFDAPTAP